jgi:hypothetical protein
MSCNNHTTFSNVSNIGETTLINQLEDNLKSFFDWGFLNIGAFINVNIPTSGINPGAIFHQLKLTNDPGFTNGKVWQTAKQDWVWETGLSYSNQLPNSISGLYINNTFYPAPTGSGSVGYSLNYPLGRVVFDRGISSANINMSYSYRWCQVHKASASPWWTELQKRSLDPDPQFKQKDKGDFNISANQRIQMPCIIIEPIARSNMTPWQLGASDFAIDQDILCHIFAENSSDKNRLADIVRLQKHKTIIMYDPIKVTNSGIYGLNYNGSINNNGLIYPDIIQNDNYKSFKCFFKDVQIIDMETLSRNLFWCTIRLTTEVIR